MTINPNANNYSLLLIHKSLAEIYLSQQKYIEALSELEQQQKVVEKLIKEDTQSINVLKNIYLEIEVYFGIFYA